MATRMKTKTTDGAERGLRHHRGLRRRCGMFLLASTALAPLFAVCEEFDSSSSATASTSTTTTTPPSAILAIENNDGDIDQQVPNQSQNVDTTTGNVDGAGTDLGNFIKTGSSTLLVTNPLESKMQRQEIEHQHPSTLEHRNDCHEQQRVEDQIVDEDQNGRSNAAVQGGKPTQRRTIEHTNEAIVTDDSYGDDSKNENNNDVSLDAAEHTRFSVHPSAEKSADQVTADQSTEKEQPRNEFYDDNDTLSRKSIGDVGQGKPLNLVSHDEDNKNDENDLTDTSSPPRTNEIGLVPKLEGDIARGESVDKSESTLNAQRSKPREEDPGTVSESNGEGIDGMDGMAMHAQPSDTTLVPSAPIESSSSFSTCVDSEITFQPPPVDTATMPAATTESSSPSSIDTAAEEQLQSRIEVDRNQGEDHVEDINQLLDSQERHQKLGNRRDRDKNDESSEDGSNIDDSESLSKPNPDVDGDCEDDPEASTDDNHSSESLSDYETRSSNSHSRDKMVVAEDGNVNDDDDDNDNGTDENEQQQYAYDSYPVDDTAAELLLEDAASKEHIDGIPSEDDSIGSTEKLGEKPVGGTFNNSTNTAEGSIPTDGETSETVILHKTNTTITTGPIAGQAAEENEGEEHVKTQDDVKSGENATLASDEKVDIDSQSEVLDEEDEEMASRFSVDYASKSAGALIIEKSKDFKGTSNLLNGDKDKYAITPCEEKKKFVVISLSEDILVKEIKLANYERFSSTMKNFQIMGSQTLGGGKGSWIDLGNYTARPGNGEQAFPIETPAWARYLKFKFKTHHGMEYYCTLSQLQVHGSTMVQGFHEQWELIEENSDESIPGSEVDETVNDPTNATHSLPNNATNTTSVEEDRLIVGSTAESGESESRNATLPPDGEAPMPHATIVGNKDDAVISVLDAFAPSAALFEILQGKCVNEELFEDMHHLAPPTLDSLPRNLARSSRDKAVMFSRDGSLLNSMSNPKVGQSISYNDAKIVEDRGSVMVASSKHDTISCPKMNEFSSSLGKTERSIRFSSLKFTWNVRSQLARLWNSTIGGDAASEKDDPARADETNKSSQLVQEEDSDESGKKDSIPDSGFHHPDIANTDSATLSASKTEERDAEGHDDYDTDRVLLQLLQDLPSAECLAELDFSSFKAKVTTVRKASGFHGATHGSGLMEPIFKKLTDEIFSLQTSLSVHDQFTKAAVACYRQVLLDLMVDHTRVNNDYSERLARLEDKMMESTLQRIVYFVSDLLADTLKWLFLQLSLVFGFFVEQYPAARRTGTKKLLQIGRWADGFSKASINWMRELFTDSSFRALEEPTKEMIRTYDHNLFESISNGEDGTWIFPVVPILLVLLMCRLLMCFAPSSGTIRGSNRPSPMGKHRSSPTSRSVCSSPASSSSAPTNDRPVVVATSQGNPCQPTKCQNGSPIETSLVGSEECNGAAISRMRTSHGANTSSIQDSSGETSIHISANANGCDPPELTHEREPPQNTAEQAKTIMVGRIAPDK